MERRFLSSYLKVKNKDKAKKNKGEDSELQGNSVEGGTKGDFALKVINIEGKVIGKDANIEKAIRGPQVVVPAVGSNMNLDAQTCVLPKSILKKSKPTDTGTNNKQEGNNATRVVHNSPSVGVATECNDKMENTGPTATPCMISSTNVPTSFVDFLNAAGKSEKENTSSLGGLSWLDFDSLLTKQAWKIQIVSLQKVWQLSPNLHLQADCKNIAFPLVKNYVNNTWGKFGLQNLTKIDDEVKLYNVPVLAYSRDGLSLIATQIGKPIMLDAFASLMCVNSWGRISFACALIEVYADSVLKKEVVMAIEIEEGSDSSRQKKSDGSKSGSNVASTSGTAKEDDQVIEQGPWLIRNVPLILTKWSTNMSLSKDEVTRVPNLGDELGEDVKDGHSVAKIRVEYEWKPLVCIDCKVFGHTAKQCPKKVVVQPRTAVVVDGDGFTTVVNHNASKPSTSGSQKAGMESSKEEGTNGIKLKNLFEKLNDITYIVDPNIGDEERCGLNVSDATFNQHNDDSESDIEEAFVEENPNSFKGASTPITEVNNV
ncbi:putative reverse transcriptase domain-containing protein [Tanacetum coccineum]